MTKDLQRLIWVWDQSGRSTLTPITQKPLYRIANYGLGKICLERVGDYAAECIDEMELQVEFERILELLWVKKSRRKSRDSGDGDGGCDSKEEEEEEDEGVDFIETLGLAPIHESLTPLTSFRTGQQRLQDLKGGVIRVKTESLRKANDDGSASKTLDATTDRRKGLLDRIKSKQLRQSKLPPPPSKEMLLRRAAAERVEDVVRVLALLRPAGSMGSGSKGSIVAAMQRKPFRVEMIVQHVQDSMRNPISQEEVEICLDILSQADVAGQWVGLVTVKGIKSVVLKSCDDVSPKEIGARVRQMKIGW